MDISLHLAAAACTGSVILYLESQAQPQTLVRWRNLALSAVCFGAALASHLLLDLIPHYDLVLKVLQFRWLPHVWRFGWELCKVGAAAFPAAFLFLSLNRDRWVLVLASIGGGVYPDIEKTLYLHWGLPRWLVIAPGHSCAYSPLGWEYTHKYLVIGFEVGLFVLLVWGMYWLSHRRRGLRGAEGLIQAWADLLAVLRGCLVLWRATRMGSLFDQINRKFFNNYTDFS